MRVICLGVMLFLLAGCSLYSEELLVKLHSKPESTIDIIDQRPASEKRAKNLPDRIDVSILDDRRFSPDKMIHLQNRLSNEIKLKPSSIEVLHFEHKMYLPGAMTLINNALSQAGAVVASQATEEWDVISVPEEVNTNDYVTCTLEVLVEDKRYKYISKAYFPAATSNRGQFKRDIVREKTREVTDNTISQFIKEYNQNNS